MSKPRLLITLGDVAGIGPEVVARAWAELVKEADPIVVGDPAWVERGLKLSHLSGSVQTIAHPSEAKPSGTYIPCLLGSKQDLSRVISGKATPRGSRDTRTTSSPAPTSPSRATEK